MITGLRTAGALLGITAWLLGSRWLLAEAPDRPWALLLLIGPLLPMLLLRARRRPRLAPLGLALALAAALAWLTLADADPRWTRGALVAEFLAFQGLLGGLFLRSLAAGSTPLVQRIAERLRGPLTPAEQRYTRQVTTAWAVFFALAAVAGLAVALLAPWTVFSWVAGVGVPTAAALLMAFEVALRRRLHPASRHGWPAMVAAWRASTRAVDQQPGDGR